MQKEVSANAHTTACTPVESSEREAFHSHVNSQTERSQDYTKKPIEQVGTA